ncbi:MAG: type II toxin-antitoxin system mRNA interferase toxin, RelE/StbE family [Candidatus Pacebacteria bacterium]|jgi:addiction module RelE/StbE family toxin|nr:type II toxin-antitoxin system mRNA interferase toxin, RelE/StbE family [Candidatus Paceibacterota bacterium]MBP9700950.1 type II toxin-antitoxin system mRNA interferase toxin, RelE/StbE family [Candidatus Paceibacterota bacterium]
MNIERDRVFKKQYRTLSQKIQKQVVERLMLFAENKFHPQLNNHSLHHPFEGCRSINISGDIRAIYRQYGDTILFIRIGTHSELYK